MTKLNRTTSGATAKRTKQITSIVTKEAKRTGQSLAAALESLLTLGIKNVRTLKSAGKN